MPRPLPLPQSTGPIAAWLRPGALLALILAALLLSAPPAPAQGAPVRIEAEGRAYVSGTADRDAARQRALGEALISAALSGGASLSGYTVQDKGRITADMTILRPTGRVLSSSITSAQLRDGVWIVRITALVGPVPAGACSKQRRVTISATPPAIDVRADAPAWAVPMAQQLARDVAATLQRHPAIDLESVAPAPGSPLPAAMDYTTLTRGRPGLPAGNHRMSETIAVSKDRNTIRLELALSFRGPGGETFSRWFRRRAELPRGGLTGFVRNQSRDRTLHTLTDGLDSQIYAALNALACQPPQAQIALRNGQLTVPLGSRHGLSRAALAFVDDRGAGYGLLEITRLGAREATLRPLDPARPAAGFAGKRVYFVEVGL